MFKLIKIIFLSLFVSLFLFTSVLYASKYITKKSNNSKEIEQIDKMYAEGFLTKSECVKLKTKVLDLKTEVKTICDNVKVVKKEPKKKKKESSFITKKSKEEKKKAKTEYIKKKKDLSKEAKKYVKKKPKKADHINTVAKLPNSEIYIVAVSENNDLFIGYVNQDPDSVMMSQSGRKFRKGNKGMAFLINSKTTCSIYSEVDIAKEMQVYLGNIVVDCGEGKDFLGQWSQRGTSGFGSAKDKSGTMINFEFTTQRYEANAFLSKSKSKLLAKKDNERKVVEEPEEKTITQTKKIVERYPPKITTKLEIKSSETCFNITGTVKNKNAKQIFLEIDDEAVAVKNGKFNEERCSLTSRDYPIVAFNEYGKKDELVVKVIILKKTVIVEKLENLKPKMNAPINKNRVAIIIGIEKYKSTALARHANEDARWFSKYAKKAFGISDNNIALLVDDQATLIESKSKLKIWLRSKIKEDQTELIIFFSGHGLAGDEGKELYLLTYDSKTELDELEFSALKRTEIFEIIEKHKPKSVLMFIDACYSGFSRDDVVLIANAKGIIVTSSAESDVPENFTIFSASTASQISSALKEPKHGIFSYYLMKGMEGKADSDKDRKITYKELDAYLKTNINESANVLGRQQNPSLILGQNVNADDVILTY